MIRRRYSFFSMLMTQSSLANGDLSKHLYHSSYAQIASFGLSGPSNQYFMSKLYGHWSLNEGSSCWQLTSIGCSTLFPLRSLILGVRFSLEWTFTLIKSVLYVLCIFIIWCFIKLLWVVLRGLGDSLQKFFYGADINERDSLGLVGTKLWPLKQRGLGCIPLASFIVLYMGHRSPFVHTGSVFQFSLGTDILKSSILCRKSSKGNAEGVFYVMWLDDFGIPQQVAIGSSIAYGASFDDNVSYSFTGVQ
ncbi:hypothetical protein Tco_1329734 [Tanacetum coccineum]